jgi:hypothetical protein
MANPTTNYGFVLPTSSDLVTDLPADFDVALQGVDTRLKALNPETTLGDIAYRSATANTNTRLGIGSTGNVLTVSGGVPVWAAPATGGGMTLLHTITLSTTSHTQSSISQAYRNLYVVGQNLGAASGAALRIRCAGRTGGYIYSYITKNAIAAGADGGFDGVSNDLSNTGGSACQFTFYDYAETSSEKLVMGQMVGNATGDVTLCAGSPFNLQTNISSITITTVGGSVNLSGTILIYGVN